MNKLEAINENASLSSFDPLSDKKQETVDVSVTDGANKTFFGFEYQKYLGGSLNQNSSIMEFTSKKPSVVFKSSLVKGFDNELSQKKEEIQESSPMVVDKSYNQSMPDTPILDVTPIFENKQKGQKKGALLKKGTLRKDLQSFCLIIKLFLFIKPKLLWFYEHYTLSGLRKGLTLQIRQIINDISDPCSQKSLSPNIIDSSFNSLSKFIQEFAVFIGLNKIPIFDPENKLRIIFNTLLLSYNIFYLFILNFHIVFSAEFGVYQDYFRIIALFSWTIEMLMEMNTSRYYKSEFVTDRKKIATIIIKKNFIFEMIPLLCESFSSSNRIVNIMLTLPILLKIRGMIVISIQLEFFILQQFKQRYFLEIFKLIFKLFLLTHIMACSYYLFAQIEIFLFKFDTTWLQQVTLTEEDWLSYYIEAQVWAFSTICSTVSKAISTSEEYLFTSFWMLISCIAFAYMINKIGEILKELNEQSEIYRRDLNLLNQFMNRKHINLGLQRRLNLDLKQQFEQERLKQIIDIRNTLHRLSEPSYKQLMKESYKEILHDLPFFKDCVSEESMQQIYEIMEELAFSTNQIIEEDTTSSSSLYMVLSGRSNIYLISKKQQFHPILFKVSLKIKKSTDSQSQICLSKENREESEIQTINPGGSFGLYEFLTGMEKQYYAKSEDLSVVVRVDMEKFLEIIKSSDIDYQRYMEFKERLQYSINQRELKLECLICHCEDHHLSECHFVHFNKKNPYPCYRFSKSENQVRDTLYERKSQKENKRVYFQVDENQQYHSQLSLNHSETTQQNNTNYNEYQTCHDLEMKLATTVNRINFEKSHISTNNINNMKDSGILPTQNHTRKKRLSIDDNIYEDDKDPSPQNRSLPQHKSVLQSCNVIESSTQQPSQQIIKEIHQRNSVQLRKSFFDSDNFDDQNKEQRISLKVHFKPVSFQKLSKPSSIAKIAQKAINEEKMQTKEPTNNEKFTLHHIDSGIRNDRPSVQKSFFDFEGFQKSSYMIQGNIRNSLYPHTVSNQNNNINHQTPLQQNPHSNLQTHENSQYQYAEQGINSKQQIQDWRDSTDYWHFDMMKQFKYYFTKDNCENKIKKLQILKIRRVKIENSKANKLSLKFKNKTHNYLNMMQTIRLLKSKKKEINSNAKTSDLDRQRTRSKV